MDWLTLTTAWYVFTHYHFLHGMHLLRTGYSDARTTITITSLCHKRVMGGCADGSLTLGTYLFFVLETNRHASKIWLRLLLFLLSLCFSRDSLMQR